MRPADLNAAHFSNYPSAARGVALAHLAVLRQLPLAFLVSLLRELIEYDFKFPAERASLDQQLAYLSALPAAQLAQVFTAFAKIRIAPNQASQAWCSHPFDFTEQFSAYLWQTQQMDAFRKAAAAFGELLHVALPSPPLPMPRLGIAVIGQGATPQPDVQLFARLREHGTLFRNVDPEGGVQDLLEIVEARARLQPTPYAHWYIDGGLPLPHVALLTCVSYAQLAPVRAALLAQIQKQVSKAGMGPEELRDHMGHLSPADLGMDDGSVLDHFKLKVLTEGSGTQIFSTTFAQWTAREALRRAEALTLLVRFTPRQQQRPMNELLTTDPKEPALDAQGSLIDADMAAYYQWINQQRLPGFGKSSFLVWFEGQRQALAVSPTLPHGTTSNSPVTLQSLLMLMSM